MTDRRPQLRLKTALTACRWNGGRHFGCGFWILPEQGRYSVLWWVRCSICCVLVDCVWLNIRRHCAWLYERYDKLTPWRCVDCRIERFQMRTFFTRSFTFLSAAVFSDSTLTKQTADSQFFVAEIKFIANVCLLCVCYKLISLSRFSFSEIWGILVHRIINN